MGAARITRTDRTAAELRATAGKCRDGAQERRMLALAMVLEGRPRTEAAQQNGMDRQTLRDWVHRYDAAGIDGLKSLQSPGPPTALTAVQIAEMLAPVVQDPKPAQRHGASWSTTNSELGRSHIGNGRVSVFTRAGTWPGSRNGARGNR